jgi:hypothetical protein
MFDRKQFRDHIEARLQTVSEDKCVAFAVRSAMRVMPLLAARQGAPFRHWKPEDKSKYLLAVFRNYARGVEYVLTKGHIDPIAANKDAHIVHAAGAEAAYVDVDCSTVYATNAAYIAYTACAENPRTAYQYAHLLVPASYNYATAAAYTADAAIDIDADTAIIEEIQQDLIAVDKMIAERLLQQPLWSKEMPKEWHQLDSRFKFASSKLNAGFEVWLDWYEDRLQGKPIDMQLLRQWNSIPTDIENQGVVAMNAYLKNQLLTLKPEPPKTTGSYLRYFHRLWRL